MMTLPNEGKLLRIFIGENDKYEKMPLFEWIVRKARDEGLAGATVLRGLEGYGAHSRLHTAKILRLSADLPIVIEIIDAEEKIEAFLKKLSGHPSKVLIATDSIKGHFKFMGLPHTIVLDKNNIVRKNLSGFTEANMKRLEKTLKGL